MNLLDISQQYTYCTYKGKNITGCDLAAYGLNSAIMLYSVFIYLF